MSVKKLLPYLGCSPRFIFRCNSSSQNAENWFQEALGAENLRNIFDGSIRTLCQKGRVGEIYVRAIKDPRRIPDVTFHVDGKNNYELGLGENIDSFDWKYIKKHNPAGYTYFQDERFFLAVRKLYVDNGTNQLLLWITKKKQKA